jgi:hypothetical protein
MRTTLALDDELLAKAEFYARIREKSVLVREGLKALVEREAARRLVRLGGSEPDLTGCGKSRNFEKTAMKWARCRNYGSH